MKRHKPLKIRREVKARNQSHAARRRKQSTDKVLRRMAGVSG